MYLFLYGAIFKAHPFQWLRNGFSLIKIILYVPRHIRYINPLPDGPLAPPLTDGPRSDWT